MYDDYLPETHFEDVEIAHLKEMFEAQAKLDATIHENHNVNYEVTHDRRILALLVEIGEFANTTRCFKYWSNKGMEEKETVLDEYADGMHFFLSLGIDIGTTKIDYEIRKMDTDLTSQIHFVYSRIEDFKKQCDDVHYCKSLLRILTYSSFIRIYFSGCKRSLL